MTLFETEQALADGFNRYSDHIENNPLVERTPANYKGKTVMVNVPKPRAMTLQGLCFFLGIRIADWEKMKDDKAFVGIVERIEYAIFDQKFGLGAVGLMNGTMISRDLGLADKQEVTAQALEPVAVVIEPVSSGTFLPKEDLVDVEEDVE